MEKRTERLREVKERVDGVNDKEGKAGKAHEGVTKMARRAGASEEQIGRATRVMENAHEVAEKVEKVKGFIDD